MSIANPQDGVITSQKVPISMRALHQRINRKLAQQEEVLKKTRGEQARSNLGDYYVVHWRFNLVRNLNVDPIALGRDLGVLAAWEVVAEGESA